MVIWNTRAFKLGAGALALGAIGLLTPRAAHALAATLVQVTNTIANPAITQGTNTAASQLVLLQTPFGGSLSPNSPLTALDQIIPTSGLSTSPYVVPAGQTLVVTGMDVTAYGPGGAFMVLVNPAAGGNTPVAWVSVPKSGTQQQTFATGIAFPAGAQVLVFNSVGATGSADVFVRGYLTTN
jgi:hypothetical protein